MLRQPIAGILRRCSPPYLNSANRQIHCLLERQSRMRQLPLLVLRTNPPQPRRNLFNKYRQRVQYERQTGNWRSLQVPVVAAILTTTVGLLLFLYGYTKYQEWAARALHNYPPSVAKELRRALYYSRNPGSSSYSPKDAARHFIVALEKAREEGMHPLSNEVTGIKIEIARLCEESGRKDKAVEVLRDVWNLLRRGLEIWDTKVKEGTENSSMKPAREKQEEEETPVQGKASGSIAMEQRKAGLEVERAELARRAVRTGVKLGNLLLEDWPEEQAQAGELGEKQRTEEGERVLESTIAMIIAEEQRMQEKRKNNRELPSVTETALQDGWLMPVEMASAFEILATHYLTTSRPQLATPLLIHAIHTLYPPNTSGPLDDPARLCHAATLMNTISAAISEVPVVLPMPRTVTSPQPALIPSAAAEYWANMAEGLTALKPDASPELSEILKSEECRQAHVTALINLAELRLQREDRETARKLFQQARKEAKNVGWEDGVHRAEEGFKTAGEQQ
ncbi:hypothetical protein EV426DRAFT_427223 [Tirmania nivea]|nr:hypothetical protein EV426DRAFT_427223 [Tirmania nivea]